MPATTRTPPTTSAMPVPKVMAACGLAVCLSAAPARAQGDPLEQPWASSQSFTSMLGSGAAWRVFRVPDGGLLGVSVAAAADVNGDGVGDAIFGAPSYDAGEAYVVFGPPSIGSLSRLDGTNGFTFRGAAADDEVGGAVGSGDFNGDGLSDVLIGAYNAGPSGPRMGVAYVIFGRDAGFPASLGPADLDGTNGFRIPITEPRDFLGQQVSGAGDLNGDGIDDLMVSGGGTVFVVFGSTSGFEAEFDVSTLDGSNGFRLDTSGPGLGLSLSAAGDTNGDGLADAIVSGDDSAFVVFGRSDGFPAAVSVDDFDGSDGFEIDGSGVHYSVGFAVSSAGDINGDGLDDVAVGAPYAGSRGDGFRSQGFAFVVFGESGSVPPVFDLRDVDGSNGFRMEGATNEDTAGNSFAGGGDLNGDGFDDLVVGAPGTGYTYTCSYCTDYSPAEGSAFVIYGSNSFDAAIDLTDVSADSVIRFDGPPDSNMAFSLSGMTDFNGDGRLDFLLGAIGSRTVTAAGMAIYGRGQRELCPADLDGDGELTLFDFLAFQNLFDAGDPQADFDGDGELTLFDFLSFQNAFDAGCG